jgi:hypothetical protein
MFAATLAFPLLPTMNRTPPVIEGKVGDALADYASGKMSDERLDWHVWNWARWHRARGRRQGDHQGRASGGIGKSGSSDFDAMVAAEDTRSAYAVEAIVNDLPAPQSNALHHVQLEAVFRFTRADPRPHYDAALAAIRAGLVKRGIW